MIAHGKLQTTCDGVPVGDEPTGPAVASTAVYLVCSYGNAAPDAAFAPEPPSKLFRVEYASLTNGRCRFHGTYMIPVETRLPDQLRRRVPLPRKRVRPYRWHYYRCRRDKW